MDIPAIMVTIVVITAKDLTAEDRQRLNGQVIQILKKGAYRTEELLAEMHRSTTR